MMQVMGDILSTIIVIHAILFISCYNWQRDSPCFCYNTGKGVYVISIEDILLSVFGRHSKQDFLPFCLEIGQYSILRQFSLKLKILRYNPILLSNVMSSTRMLRYNYIINLRLILSD
jgi:hypothetical protein